MKFIFLLISSVTLAVNAACAQSPLVKQWDFRYGGTGNDKLSVFQQTSDLGFILGGFSYSDSSGDKSQANYGTSLNADFWVVKIDLQGHKQWDKRFGGTLNDELKALQQTNDGGYILGGYSNSGISGDKTQANWDVSGTAAGGFSNDYWIVKIDSLGNKEWDKRFGGIYDDKLSSLQQTSDKGYILGGYSGSGISGDKTQPSWGSTDYWIVKTDSLGNKQWDKRFGGSNNDQLYSIRQTNDGGYMLGGFTWSQVSGDKTQPNYGAANYCDYWIVKIDASGNKEWDRRFGGTNNDELISLQQTSDDGYILGGYSWSGISGDKTQTVFGTTNASDYWIVKIDSVGNIQWDKDFGGTSLEDEFGNVSQTTDGGYLIGSTSYSDAGGNKSENNMGVEQSWIVKTDALGNKQWDKTIFTTGHDEAGYAIETGDGSYVVANYSNSGTGGYSTSPNRDITNATSDYWIVKFRDSTARPVANFTTANHAFCQHSCIDFSNLSQRSDSYQWFFPGATPAASAGANPQHICYNTAGNYDVTLIAGNNDGYDTLTLHDFIKVYPPPLPFSILRAGDSLVAPQGFATYQWYYYSTAIAGGTNYFTIPTLGGTYNLLISDSNGCVMGAGIMDVKAGISENIFLDGEINTFPNPATDEITIQAPVLQNQFVTVSIANVLGEILFNEKMQWKNDRVVDVKKFSPGIYVLNLQAEKSKWVGKFMKQ